MKCVEVQFRLSSWLHVRMKCVEVQFRLSFDSADLLDNKSVLACPMPIVDNNYDRPQLTLTRCEYDTLWHFPLNQGPMTRNDGGKSRYELSDYVKEIWKIIDDELGDRIE